MLCVKCLIERVVAIAAELDGKVPVEIVREAHPVVTVWEGDALCAHHFAERITGGDKPEKTLPRNATTDDAESDRTSENDDVPSR